MELYGSHSAVVIQLCRSRNVVVDEELVWLVVARRRRRPEYDGRLGVVTADSVDDDLDAGRVDGACLGRGTRRRQRVGARQLQRRALTPPPPRRSPRLVVVGEEEQFVGAPVADVVVVAAPRLVRLLVAGDQSLVRRAAAGLRVAVPPSPPPPCWPRPGRRRRLPSRRWPRPADVVDVGRPTPSRRRRLEIVDGQNQVRKASEYCKERLLSILYYSNSIKCQPGSEGS